MHVDLIAARDAAVALHDRVVSQHGTRFDAAFASALEPVIGELERIIAAATADKSDPVELSRTLRWLGDAHFDHGRFAGQPSWHAAAQAYLRAEQLLEDGSAPIEQAKLDFNFANTLAQLSDGADVKLLEAADIRYRRAAQVFRDSFLPDLAQRVEQRYALLRPQLEAGRQQIRIGRDYRRLQELEAEAATADPIAQAQIRKELAALTQQLDPQSITATLHKSVAAVSALASTSGAEQDSIRELEAKVGAVTAALPANASVSDPASPATEYDDLARQLFARIRADEARNEISADGADHLTQSLQKFMTAIPNASDDVLTHEAKLVQMREALVEAADAVTSRQRRGSPGSRAARALSIVEALQLAIVAEQKRPMLPTYESRLANQLFADLSQLSAALEQAGDDDARVAALEPRVWRMALNVQQFARRYHLVVAKPDFAMLAEQASVKSLFISGTAALQKVARKLADRDAIELFWEARRGEVAQERWSQLLAASVTVFDIAVPDGPARMQVCYELGLALAMGKPCVVVRRADTVMPFDIEIPPIVFSDDSGANLRSLETAVYAALSGVRCGGRTPQIGDAGKAAIAAVEPHVRAAAAPGQLDVQLRMARANAGDAVALRGSLDHIVGSLGAQGPVILLPAWVPAARNSAARPQCFHVMPFSHPWSRSVRDLVAETCARHGWNYTRGDESTAQRIIPGIWQEICRASAVIIDISGFNANVGLELGLVHALGRPYRIVARGHPKDHMFPAVEKVQIHGYLDGPTPTAHNTRWLSWLKPQRRPSSAPRSGLHEIISPFLLQVMSPPG